MDSIIALRMETELRGQRLGPWTLAECLGHGKSALVFRAHGEGIEAAVKVFDRELVARCGIDVQRERIAREARLIGNKHPHLIEILDTGEDTRHDVLYVVMSLFVGKNLADALPVVPHDRVQPIVAQIGSAAEFLEELGLAHRDIKPENIGISDDFERAILLDLGVLRPIGSSSVTDQDGQSPFIGTLQYSPPEFLHRREEDTREGWRAVTFYQIGAVLHDLLARVPLFSEEASPYARLVDAVSNKTVNIHAPGSAPELRMLAQKCLLKDPAQRLQLVTWSDFSAVPLRTGSVNELKARIADRRRSARIGDGTMLPSSSAIMRASVDELRETLDRIMRDASRAAELPGFVATSESDRASIMFRYGPSRAHALAGTVLEVHVTAEIHDLSEAMTVVDVAASVAAEANCKTLPTPSAGSRFTIFRGVRADDIIAERLTKTLLLAFDRAQEWASRGTSMRSPSWIDLGEDSRG